jgi:hypothetical protein
MPIEEFKEIFVARLLDRIKGDLISSVSEKITAIPYITLKGETVKFTK